MKRPLAVLCGFSLLLLFLWPTGQRASSADAVLVANDHLLHGRYTQAISLFQKQAEGNGKETSSARAGLLEACFITGQYERVKELAGYFLSSHPQEGILQLLLGKSCLLRGEYPEALQAFDAAQRDSSIRSEARLNSALLLEKLGKVSESRILFSEVYGDAANSGERPGLAAVALQHLDRFREANDMFREAAKKNTQDLDTWIAWGNLFLEKYNQGEAASVFSDVLKVNPNRPEALLGMVLSRKDEAGAEGLETLNQALKINPNLEGAHSLLAGMAIESEDFDESARQIESCLKINPQSLKALSLKATLYYSRGQHAELEIQLREILQISPHYGQAFVDLANFCVAQRLYKEAVEFYRKAIEIDSRLWSAYSGLGINLLRLGEEQTARVALEKAYQNDPYNVWTYNTLRLMDSYSNFKVLKTTNFTLRLHKKESSLLENYVPALLEEAYQAMSLKYGYRPAGPIYFEMFPDHEDFAVRTLGVPGLGALGVCFGRGVVMDSPSARPKGSFNWGSTLWHEFAHVITLGMTNHRVPRWFSEGLSVMEEHRARPGWGDNLSLENIKAIQDKTFLPITELNCGFVHPQSHNQVQQSYFQAGEACEFIGKEFGFRRILEMLALFKTGSSLEETLRKVMNFSPSEFDKRFNTYLESQYGKTLKSVDFKVLARNDLMEDKAKLEALLDEQPDNFYANLALAGHYRKEGNTESAIRCLNKAKSVFPRYVETDCPYKQLSEIYKKQNRLAEAIRELQALTEQNDRDLDALKQLGRWLNDAARPREAIKAFLQAVYIDPFDQEIHQLLAETSFKQKDLAMASREYRALLSLDPTDKAIAHFNLANVLMQMGEKPEAKREVLQSLEIAPSYEPAQELLLKVME